MGHRGEKKLIRPRGGQCPVGLASRSQTQSRCGDWVKDRGTRGTEICRGWGWDSEGRNAQRVLGTVPEFSYVCPRLTKPQEVQAGHRGLRQLENRKKRGGGCD